MRDAAFSIPVRVYYEDTDAGGVVYYANYLKFMERARTEWLRTRGFEQDRLREEYGILFAVSRIQVNYRLPARFNDVVTVDVALRKRGRVSLDLAQTVVRADAELVCTGEVRIACVDAITFRPEPIPDLIRRGIEVEH